MVDAYETFAASAIAASSVARSIAGALLTLAGIPMYDALGLGWGNSLLGFIAIALSGFPSVFYRYGERLRARFDPDFS